MFSYLTKVFAFHVRHKGDFRLIDLILVIIAGKKIGGARLLIRFTFFILVDFNCLTLHG